MSKKALKLAEHIDEHKLSVQHLSALIYAMNGFNVLPIWPNSKKPMTVNGHKAGTTNTAVINKRWERRPKANVAICTDGYLVLDIDIKGGIDGYKALNKLEAKYGKLPITRSQATPSGGKHFIFKTVDTVPSSKNCPSPGIDVRACGGYILVMGSEIDGKPYFMDNEQIAVAPQWLVELCQSPATDDGYNDLYSHLSVSDTCINLDNLDDVITINGMGQSMKVKYDQILNKLVIL